METCNYLFIILKSKISFTEKVKNVAQFRRKPFQYSVSVNVL